jgi:hypothetical protein
VSVSIDSIDYQIKLLALLLVNPTVLRDHALDLNPDWFDDKELVSVAKAILQYHGKYHKPPTFDELKMFLHRFYCKKPEEKNEFDKLVDGLSKYDRNGLSFVYDNFKEFISYRAYKDMVLASVQALDDMQLDTIPELFRKGISRVTASHEILDYFDDPKERIKKHRRDTIPTGIKGLDEILEGGTAKGELSVILAPPKRGKSTTLINFAAHALKIGKRIVHFTTEENELQVAGRYDQRILGRTSSSILKTPIKSTKKIKKFSERGGELYIVNARGWTVTKLRSHMYRLMDDPPDIVLIDYADKLTPAHRYDQRRFDLEVIYDELVDLKKEFHMAIWTASQCNKEAVALKVPDMTNMAEAWAKAMIADLVIAVCQTDQEHNADDLRLHIVGARHIPMDTEAHCKIFRKLMRIVDRSEWVERMTNRGNIRVSGKSLRAKRNK